MRASATATEAAAILSSSGAARAASTLRPARRSSASAALSLLAHTKARSETEHRILTENAIDVVMRLDASLRRTYVSASSRTVMGYEPSELLDGSPRDTVVPEDWAIVAAWLDGVRSSGTSGETVFRVRRKDGTALWVEGRCRTLPSGAGYMTVLRDVSGRKAAEERTAVLADELARLANSDGLTGLANRRRFDAALMVETECSVTSGRPLSLLLLDVDQFKAFNDHYGHQQGDVCLRAVADAVSAAVTAPEAVVARYGGEEIAVVLPGTEAAEAVRQAERARSGVERLATDHAGNRGGLVTVSVGCAIRDSRRSAEPRKAPKFAAFGWPGPPAGQRTLSRYHGEGVEELL